jgi:hypothetical protein
MPPLTFANSSRLSLCAGHRASSSAVWGARCIDGSALLSCGRGEFQGIRRRPRIDYTGVNTILALHYCKRDRLKAKFGRLMTHSGVCIGVVGKSKGIGLMTPDSGSAALTEGPVGMAIVSTCYRDCEYLLPVCTSVGVTER